MLDSPLASVGLRHEFREQLQNYKEFLNTPNNQGRKIKKKYFTRLAETERRNCAATAAHHFLASIQQAVVLASLGSAGVLAPISGYPTYKLIDKEGNIHDLHWLHYEDLDGFKDTIDKLTFWGNKLPSLHIICPLTIIMRLA